jgi:glycosyltransferase involved in cell wall biosynthesis
MGPAIRRLRIAQVAPPVERVPPAAYGGTERVVDELNRQLAARGHELTVFASGDSDVPGRLVPTVDRALRPAGIESDASGWFASTVKMVIEQAAEFDIIHSHLEWWSIPLARLAPVPTVATFHGRLDLPWADRLFNDPLEGMVAISRHQASVHPDVPWTIIHNGLTLEKAPFLDEPGDAFCFVGRVDAEKGIIEAIDIALRAGRRLRIAAKVGNLARQRDYYESVFRPALQRAGRSVEYLGELQPTERDQLFAESYATLMPGAWPEPFGLVSIESLACGTPVLARRVGALPEIIREGVDGFFGDDAVAMAFFADRLGGLDRREIRERVIERFSAARMADRYEELYTRMIAAANGEGGVRERVPDAAEVAEALAVQLPTEVTEPSDAELPEKRNGGGHPEAVDTAPIEAAAESSVEAAAETVVETADDAPIESSGGTYEGVIAALDALDDLEATKQLETRGQDEVPVEEARAVEDSAAAELEPEPVVAEAVAAESEPEPAVAESTASEPEPEPVVAEAVAVEVMAEEEVEDIPEPWELEAIGAPAAAVQSTDAYKPAAIVEPEPAEVEPIAAEATAEPEPEPEPIAAEAMAEPEPEPIASEAVAEPEPIAEPAEAEPEPRAVAEAEPAPVAAEAMAEPEDQTVREPVSAVAEPEPERDVSEEPAAVAQATAEPLDEPAAAAEPEAAEQDPEPAAAIAQLEAIEIPVPVQTAVVDVVVAEAGPTAPEAEAAVDGAKPKARTPVAVGPGPSTGEAKPTGEAAPAASAPSESPAPITRLGPAKQTPKRPTRTISIFTRSWSGSGKKAASARQRDRS